jgi:hypothetical protein
LRRSQATVGLPFHRNAISDAQLGMTLIGLAVKTRDAWARNREASAEGVPFLNSYSDIRRLLAKLKASTRATSTSIASRMLPVSPIWNRPM